MRRGEWEDIELEIFQNIKDCMKYTTFESKYRLNMYTSPTSVVTLVEVTISSQVSRLKEYSHHLVLGSNWSGQSSCLSKLENYRFAVKAVTL